MYRTAVEGILGINVRGPVLAINPCIPRGWKNFEVLYQHGASRYRVVVENPRGVSRGIVRATLDGQEISQSACEIQLVDDGRDHDATITMG
jgi:cyclic beta-1,2-glucan synthetase